MGDISKNGNIFLKWVIFFLCGYLVLDGSSWYNDQKYFQNGWYFSKMGDIFKMCDTQQSSLDVEIKIYKALLDSESDPLENL